MTALLEGWERRDKPATLTRRFTFERYAQTRAFLMALAQLSETLGRHPQNISFGTTYANITLEAENGADFSESEKQFAARIASLAEPRP
ncbi:MAG: 4a-hydroxytetrahydrobiopterin dehydratase [Sinobacteraceae bacterium]|nr:4a-hydroxytetrahydrobiopterin dehydratase [Nevskiaceae bacterium]